MFTAVFAFTLTITAVAADESSLVPAKSKTVKPAAVKETRETQVSFTGIVKAITGTTLMVERTVRDKTETLEFTLDKTVEEIRVGDKVKIGYIKKEGKYIATRVTLFIEKRIIKKTSQS
jgi:hypothetical protein